LSFPPRTWTAQLNEKLAEAKGKMQIKGFRPGKVPISHLKKVYGKSMMAQLVNEMIQEKPTSILAERGEKAATQPEISMTEDEKEADEHPQLRLISNSPWLTKSSLPSMWPILRASRLSAKSSKCRRRSRGAGAARG
jgi:hypothetical protein